MLYNFNDYSIKIFPHDKDGDFIACIEEAPSISAFGDTPEEALKELKLVFGGWLEIQEEDGDSMPEPLKLQKFTGKMMLSIPISLHQDLTQRAIMNNVSLDREILYCLTKGLYADRIEDWKKATK